ncbi:hypothetical protein ABIF16_000596 [Bradyrhizobium elkanii]
MHAPSLDAAQVRRMEVARPPGDVGRLTGEIDDMLAGAAAGFQHVAGLAGEVVLQDGPDRLMVAMVRRRIEPTVRLDRLAVLAELHHEFRHRASPVSCM